MKNNPKLRILGILLIVLFQVKLIHAQVPNSVGIGTTLPNNSAILHLESSKQGFLMPRLTTTQIASIVSPTVGLIVFNTNDECYWYKRTTYWARLCNTDSINAGSVVTNYLNADTAIINTLNFTNSYGDSIFVHYLEADTAIINTLTVNNIYGDTAIFNYGNFNILNTDTIYNNYLESHTIKTDSLYIGGNPIQTIITDSIRSLAWLLRGNTGTNPLVNFLGTTDNNRLVFRTNNTEKVTILPTGETGFGTSSPTNKVEVVGNTKTTNFQMTSGAVNGYVLQSNAVGSGSWTPLASMISTLSPSTFSANAWTILGNGGTNPLINFLGTTDNNRLVFRTNNTEKVTILPTGETGFGTSSPTNKVEVVGNTKTTDFQMTSGAVNGYVLQSNAVGSGSWTPLASMVSTLSPATFSANAWTILGNGGTNPLVNFLGTTDNNNLVVKSKNIIKGVFQKFDFDHVIFGLNSGHKNLTIGDVAISTINPTGLPELAYGNNYIGFNLKRDPINDNVNTYISESDGAFNGASFIAGSSTGEIRFGNMPSTATGGSSASRSLFESSTAVKLIIANDGKLCFKASPAANIPQLSNYFSRDCGINFGSTFTNFIYSGVVSAAFNIGNSTSSIGLGSCVNTYYDLGTSSVGLTVGGLLIHGNRNVIAPGSGSGSTTGLRVLGFQNTLTLVGNNLSNNMNVIGDNNNVQVLSPNSGSTMNNNYIFGANNRVSAPAGTSMNGMVVLGSGLNTTNAFSGFWGYFPNGSAPGTLINSSSSVRMVGGNGYTFYTNDLGTTGVQIAPGGGSWATVSDIRLKENINNISYKAILEKINSISVTEWSYISQRPDEYNNLNKLPMHIGPMAQDFSKIFGYGEYEDKITSSDIDGVMFSGIKALAEENIELKKELEKQSKTIEELKVLINEIKNR